MNEILENQLYTNYKNLFADKDKTIQESCMAWGVECGDGWYDLIDTLCRAIKVYESNLESKKDFDDSYFTNYKKVKFDQVKEKFGGLRIYYKGGDSYVSGLVSMAEDMSYKICEICGNKGSPNKKGWISTLCDAHRNSSRTQLDSTD